MASAVQICNLALTKIGQEQITALTENSKAGRLCNLYYTPLRDAVLRSHTWNFAVARADLALSTTTPEFDYAYQFALPTNCLRVLDTNLLSDHEWKIEGRFLLCDSDTVKIRYIKQETNPNLFDALFIETLAARIAAELAQPLADSLTLQNQMFQLVDAKLSEARSIDATEGTPDDIEADAWLNARVAYVSPWNA